MTGAQRIAEANNVQGRPHDECGGDPCRCGGDKPPIEPPVPAFSNQPDDRDDRREDHFVAGKKRQPETEATNEQRRQRSRHRAGDEPVDARRQPERDQRCIEAVSRYGHSSVANARTIAAEALARRSFEMLQARRNAKPTAAAVTNELPKATSAFDSASGSGSRWPVTFATERPISSQGMS